MSAILDKLKKNSRIKDAELLSESKYFGKISLTPTPVPMMNVALSGSLDGGVSSGLTIIAGLSKHFKTSYALLVAASYLNADKDAVLLFYDSEFGSPQAYFESFGIDVSRVLHCPIKDVEELKLDLVNQLDQMDRKDKVFIIIDSIGNLASKKELEDAINEKSVTDMSRAKAIKGLFRMVTPYLTIKNVPCFGIAHTYSEMSLFPKEIVSGGRGITYSANNVWIIGRQQDKVGTEVKGYHFIINIEKSRFVKEKSKIPISVSWEGGIEKYSGLIDLAIEAGIITKTGQFCQLTDLENGGFLEGKVRPKAIKNEYWEALIKYQPFYDFIKNKYTLGMVDMITDKQTEDTEEYED
jgi:RecA/RadA recombinase